MGIGTYTDANNLIKTDLFETFNFFTTLSILKFLKIYFLLYPIGYLEGVQLNTLSNYST